MNTLFDLSEIPEKDEPHPATAFVVTFTDSDSVTWYYRKPTGYEEYTGQKTEWILPAETRMKPKRYKTLATAQAACKRLNARRTPKAIAEGVVCTVQAWQL